MNDLGTPVLDNHMHIDRENQGIEAVKDFHRLGGTHLLVVNKPSWHLGVEAETGEDFRAVFEETVSLVEEASEVLRGRAWPVLGVHPGLVTRLTDERGFEPHEARDLMQEGLSVAAEYVRDGQALALPARTPSGRRRTTSSDTDSTSPPTVTARSNSTPRRRRTSRTSPRGRPNVTCHESASSNTTRRVDWWVGRRA